MSEEIPRVYSDNAKGKRSRLRDVGANRTVVPEVKTQNKRRGSRFSQYRFPEDLGPNAFVLNFYEYDFAKTFESVSQTLESKTAIVLPLPQQLVDTDSITINSAQLGTTGAVAADVLTGTGALGELLNAAEQAGGKTAEALKAAVAGNYSALSGMNAFVNFAVKNALTLSPTFSLVGDIASKTAINPHTTLDFDGVELKEFTFSWQLAPKSEKESDSIKDIVGKIKSHILPKYTSLGGSAGFSSRAMLKYPDIAHIRLNGIDPDHFPQLMPGMITNFSVDYTPQGNVLLAGGKPAMVNISMSFREAQIRTSGSIEPTMNPHTR